MINILKKLCKDGNLIAIYTNRSYYDKFSVGYILAVTEENILIQSLSPRGEFDGYSVIKTDSVYRLETDEMYLDKIRRLLALKGYNNEFPAIDTNGDILINIINYAIGNKQIVTICIDEDASDIIGYIVDFTGDKVKVLQVSEYGQNNGETIFPLQEIIKICVNDTICMDLDILYRNN